jgi:hypothetical protein
MPDNDGGQPAGPPSRAGHGLLIITFEYPTRAIAALYEVSTPTLRIDGQPVPVTGWGRHELLLPIGEHLLEVHAVIDDVRMGIAEHRLAIVEGAEAAIVYEAPRLPVAPGHMHAPGETAKVELSPLLVTFALVAVVVVVGYLVVALLR